MSTLEKTLQLRFLFMETLYQYTQGDRHKFTDLDAIAASLGLTRDHVIPAANYLEDEGLIKFMSDQGHIALTHAGVKEVEQALSDPKKPTTHFPPFNLIHIEHMTQSQIQQGTVGGVQQITQVVTPGESDAIKTFLTSLEAVKLELNLTAEAEAELEAQVATIEGQMKSANPRRSILKEAGSAVVEILSSAPGRAAIEELLKRVPDWVR